MKLLQALILGAVALGSLTFATPVQADDHWRYHHHHHHHYYHHHHRGVVIHVG